MTEKESKELEREKDEAILCTIDVEQEVEYGLTNDYMFRSVFQTSKEALKGLLSALLYIPEDAAFYNEYALKNRRTGYEFTGKIALHVLDLSCLKQVPEEERNSALYYWACVFKAKTWKEVLAMTEQSESIKKAVVTLRKLSEDEKIRLQCEARERYQMDWQSSMRTSREKGREEGRESGRKEMIELMNRLIKSGRQEDMKRAIEDEEYMERLMKELKLTDKISRS